MNKKREQQLHQKWQDKQRNRKASNLAGFAAEYMIVDDVWVNDASKNELSSEIAHLRKEVKYYQTEYALSQMAVLEEKNKVEQYKNELVQTIDDHKMRKGFMEEDLRKLREENAKLKAHNQGLEAAIKALTPAPESDDPIERAVQRAEKRNW